MTKLIFTEIPLKRAFGGSMNFYYGTRFRYLIFLFALYLSIAGCASFQGREFANHADKQLQPMPNKPTVDFTIKYPGDVRFANVIPFSIESFEDHLNVILYESKLFKRYNAGIGGGDYHFSISMDTRQQLLLGVVSALFCGSTLTILPAYTRIDYALSVDVSKGGQFIKRYEYNQYVSTWVELFLVVLTASHFPRDINNQAVDQMLREFLYDFQKDVVSEHASHP